MQYGVIRYAEIAEVFAQSGSEGVVGAVLGKRADTNRRFLPSGDKDHGVLHRLQQQGTVPESFRISHDDKTFTR